MLSFIWIVPESPHWLCDQGRFEQMASWVNYQQKMNKKEIEIEPVGEGGEARQEEAVEEPVINRPIQYCLAFKSATLWCNAGLFALIQTVAIVYSHLIHDVPIAKLLHHSIEEFHLAASIACLLMVGYLPFLLNAELWVQV